VRTRRRIALACSLAGLLAAAPARAAAERAPEAASAARSTFRVAGAFCAPRSGSPLASAAGFGVAAFAIAWVARRRGRPSVG